MIIYSYYQEIDFKYQNSLLGLWRESWEKNGFKVTVLNKKDAEKNKFYEEFFHRLNKIHEFITGKLLNKYGSSCWLRWLAYANQNEEKFFISDYDIINNNFSTDRIDDILHFMDGDCPCIASGRPSQFQEFLIFFINYCEKNLSEIKFEFNNMRYNHPERGMISYPIFHDQVFLMILEKIKSYDNLPFKISRDRSMLLSTPAQKDFQKNKLIHFQFDECIRHCLINNIEYPIGQEIKVFLIKKILNL